MDDTTTLRAWLDRAWDEHADAPQRVADGLRQRAATLPDDAEGAEAVRMALHVMLAHLADPPALRQWLDTLPAQPALAPAVASARWALAAIDGVSGTDVPAVPDALRWRALHAVLMVQVLRGDTAAARARLLADEAAAMAHADVDAQRAYAVTSNNVALDLRLGARGDAGRDALMIDAAQLSRRVWERAGTWTHVERADYQLAMCHAVLGQGAEALAHAQACLSRCEAEGADAAERFFAHECQVHAARAAGDTALAAAHREQMVALLAQVDDAGMRDWCAQTLAST